MVSSLDPDFTLIPTLLNGWFAFMIAQFGVARSEQPALRTFILPCVFICAAAVAIHRGLE
jgi:hypothetical protein